MSEQAVLSQVRSHICKRGKGQWAKPLSLSNEIDKIPGSLFLREWSGSVAVGWPGFCQKKALVI